MRASIEISMYPLDEQFRTPILNFIKQLHSYQDLIVKTNGMSTQVFGEIDYLLSSVSACVKKSCLEENKVVFVMKIVNADLEQ